MTNTQQQPLQTEDNFTLALADVLLHLRRRREERQAQQANNTNTERGTNE